MKEQLDRRRGRIFPRVDAGREKGVPVSRRNGRIRGVKLRLSKAKEKERQQLQGQLMDLNPIWVILRELEAEIQARGGN